MKTLKILGGVILLLLLMGGAFLLGQRLPANQETQSAPAQEGKSDESVMSDEDSSSDQGSQPGGKVIILDNGSGPVRITFAEAPEMPDEPLAVGGLFVRRQDNSIYVGTGNIEVDIEVENDEVSVNASHDGPDIEVVVTGSTIIYEDITELPIIGPEDAEKGEMVVQRVVKLVDSLEGITDNMEIRVWGEQSGERVIADVLVYEAIGK
jgi:hypothetical protein